MEIKDILNEFEGLEPLFDSMEDETGTKEIVEGYEEDNELGLYIQTDGYLYNKYLAKALNDGSNIAWDRLVDEAARRYRKEISSNDADAPQSFTQEEKQAAKEYIQDYYAAEMTDAQREATGRKYQALTVKSKTNESLNDYTEFKVYSKSYDNGKEKLIGKNRDFKDIKKAVEFADELIKGGYTDVYIDGVKAEDETKLFPLKYIKDGIVQYDDIDSNFAKKDEDFKPADMKKAKYKDMKIEKPEEEKAPIKEEVAEKLSFKLGDSDVEVTNSTDADITAEDVKDAIEEKNPTIFFNNDGGYHYIWDFSFEKDGKKYWIESKHIEGDFSKFDLNIYESLNESVAGSLLESLDRVSDAEVKHMLEEKPADMEKAEYDEVEPIKPEVDENGKKAEKELKEGVEDKTVNFMNKPLHYEFFNKRSDGGFVTLEVGKGELKDNDEDCYILVGYSANTNQFMFTVIYEDSEKNCDIADSFLKDEISKADLENLKNALYDEYGKKAEKEIKETIDDSDVFTVSKYRVEVLVSHPNESDDGDAVIEPFDTDDFEEAKKVYADLYNEYRDEETEVALFELEDSTYYPKFINGEGLSKKKEIDESRADKIRKGVYKRVKHESLNEDKYRDVEELIEEIFGKVGTEPGDFRLYSDIATAFVAKNRQGGGITGAIVRGKNLKELTLKLEAIKDYIAYQQHPEYFQETLNEEGGENFKFQIGDKVKITAQAKAEGEKLFGADFQYGDLEGEVKEIKKGGEGYPNVITIKTANGEEDVAETMLELSEAKEDSLGELNSRWKQYEDGTFPLSGKAIQLNIEVQSDPNPLYLNCIICQNKNSKAKEFPYMFELNYESDAGNEYKEEGYSADVSGIISKAMDAIFNTATKLECETGLNEYDNIYPSDDDEKFLRLETNESLNEIKKETAEEVNVQKQVNSLEAEAKAKLTGDEKDIEKAKKLADKATKSNQLIKKWKKAKGIEESVPKAGTKSETINEEVVVKFDEGKHEIVHCENGYYNRYNIKEGKAGFTTKCVKKLPTAISALKRRFPQAEEVHE